LIRLLFVVISMLLFEFQGINNNRVVMGTQYLSIEIRLAPK